MSTNAVQDRARAQIRDARAQMAAVAHLAEGTEFGATVALQMQAVLDTCAWVLGETPVAPFTRRSLDGTEARFQISEWSRANDAVNMAPARRPDYRAEAVDETIEYLRFGTSMPVTERYF